MKAQRPQLHDKSIIHRVLLSLRWHTTQGTWRRECQVRPYPSVDRIKEIQFFDVLITEIPAIATVFCGHLVATPTGPVHVHHGTRSRLSGLHSHAPQRASGSKLFSRERLLHDTVSVERDTNCLLMISTRQPFLYYCLSSQRT